MTRDVSELCVCPSKVDRFETKFARRSRFPSLTEDEQGQRANIRSAPRLIAFVSAINVVSDASYLGIKLSGLRGDPFLQIRSLATSTHYSRLSTRPPFPVRPSYSKLHRFFFLRSHSFYRCFFLPLPLPRLPHSLTLFRAREERAAARLISREIEIRNRTERIRISLIPVTA